MSVFGWTVNVYVSVHLVSEPTYPYVNVSTHFFSFRTDGFDGQSIVIVSPVRFTMNSSPSVPFSSFDQSHSVSSPAEYSSGFKSAVNENLPPFAPIIHSFWLELMMSGLLSGSSDAFTVTSHPGTRAMSTIYVPTADHVFFPSPSEYQHVNVMSHFFCLSVDVFFGGVTDSWKFCSVNCRTIKSSALFDSTFS